MFTTFTYLLIMMFFGLLMFISLWIGGGDGDIDHEVSLTDHDAETADSGEETMGTVHASGMLQGWLSLKVFSAFGTAFGAAGLVARLNGVPYGWSLAIAIASGLVLAAGIRMFIRLFRRAECNSSFSRSQLVGQKGTVILGILDGKIGEVQFVLGGELVTVPARSEDGKAIQQGTTVTATVSGAVMTVKQA